MAHLLSLLEGACPPDRPVIRGVEDALSFATLCDRSRTLSRSLQLAGVNSLVLHLDNGPDWVVADLACQQAEIRITPLPTWFSGGQIAHVLETTAPDAVITQHPDAWRRLPASPGLRSLDVNLASGQAFLLPRKATPAAVPPNCGKITFTSGSTGQPKGVCLDNRALLDHAAVLANQVGLRAPRHLCALPLSTLLENVAGVYAPLLAGGTVQLLPLADLGYRGSSEVHPHGFLSALDHHQPNSLIVIPQLLQLMITAAHSGWQVPESLEFVAVGGARVATGAIDEAHRLGIPAYEGYGLSECASVVTLNVPGRHREGSCGKPLPNLDVDIEEGEIVVTGNAMLGYVGEPESWHPQRIHTGDLGHVDNEGFVYIDGRSKNLLINSFGRNISPEWVESEVLAHAGLADCVVLGDAKPYCVALLSARDNTMTNAAIQAWIDQCNIRLPDYARIIRWHRLAQPLVHCDGLLTDNGRPRREVIMDRFYTEIEDMYPTQRKEVFA
jgi:long-subunit acyl-CoA synthetase (AMP-forming)